MNVKTLKTPFIQELFNCLLAKRTPVKIAITNPTKIKDLVTPTKNANLKDLLFDNKCDT